MLIFQPPYSINFAGESLLRFLDLTNLTCIDPDVPTYFTMRNNV